MFVCWVAYSWARAGGSRGASDYLKAAAFGGMDGIITTFAVVASVAGANLASHIVIIMVARRGFCVVFFLCFPAEFPRRQGFANLIGDGASMGFGEYMSMRQELQFARQERAREAWEYDNYPEVQNSGLVNANSCPYFKCPF